MFVDSFIEYIGLARQLCSLLGVKYIKYDI